MDEAIRLNVVMYITTLLGTGTVGSDDDGKTWFVFWEAGNPGHTAVITRHGHVDIFTAKKSKPSVTVGFGDTAYMTPNGSVMGLKGPSINQRRRKTRPHKWLTS